MHRRDVAVLLYVGEGMKLSQGEVVQGLVDELLETIHKYDDVMFLSTAIGCLELVKQQLINDSLEDA
jgi:hypothetical protein